MTNELTPEVCARKIRGAMRGSNTIDDILARHPEWEPGRSLVASKKGARGTGASPIRCIPRETGLF